MYTEQDYIESNRRTRRSWIGTGIAAAVVLGFYVYALVTRVKWLAYAAGALLFVAVAYGLIAHILPNYRYRQFLLDMQRGGSHEMAGMLVSVGQEEELQDGVRVLQVHLLLDVDAEDRPDYLNASKAAVRLEADQAQDERILYLNASKAANFPPAGARVKLRCFGRHITECVSMGA